MDKEIQLFLKFHLDHINFLKDKVESIEVKYGVVQYCN